MNKNVKTATLLFGIFVMLASIAYGATTVFVTIPTTGRVTASMVTNPSNIEWGDMAFNTVCTRVVDLTNTGNATISNLNMTYTFPSNLTGTLTWDLEGTSLAVGDTEPAQLNLTLTNAPLNEYFSFDINITGES